MKHAAALLTTLAALAIAAPAANADGTIDQRLSSVATTLAGRPATVLCYDTASWAIFVAAHAWPVPPGAFTDRARSTIHFGADACADINRYLPATPPATPPAAPLYCQTGTKDAYGPVTVYETRIVTVTKRIKVRGKWVTKRVRVTKRVAVTEQRVIGTEAVYGICPVQPPPPAPPPGPWNDSDVGWVTSLLAHESMHIAGIRDEKTAECWGLQLAAQTAVALGATPERAASAAKNRATWYATGMDDASKAIYWSPECRPGGTLDRTPGDGHWP